MVNGTTGVFADRNGVIEHIELRTPYTNERLQAAIERVARILGQDLTGQNPILNTRLPDGSRVAVVGAAVVGLWPDADRPQIQTAGSRPTSWL